MAKIDDESLGMLYAAAVAQQAAAQSAVQQMGRVLAELRAQPDALREVAASAVHEWMDKAGTEAVRQASATAQTAAAEFSRSADKASADVLRASSVARAELTGASWYMHGLVFFMGMFVGSVCLWVLYTPDRPVVHLDAKTVADNLMSSLQAACPTPRRARASQKD